MNNDDCWDISTQKAGTVSFITDDERRRRALQYPFRKITEPFLELATKGVLTLSEVAVALRIAKELGRGTIISPITQAEISRSTGLTKGTVSKSVKYLTGRNIILYRLKTKDFLVNPMYMGNGTAQEDILFTNEVADLEDAFPGIQS